MGFFGLIGACCGGLTNNNNRNDDRCNCAGNGNFGQGAGVLVIVIVIVFAPIVIFVGIILSVMIITEILRRHTKKLWLKQETKKYIVKDFEGRLEELQTISTRRRATTPQVNNQNNNGRVLINPSAPVHYYPSKTFV